MPRLLPLLRARPIAQDTDRALVGRFAATSDPAAFAELVRRHGPLVLGVCRRAARDPDLADDAFQATFLVLARKAHALRNPDALPSWLFGVARKVATAARRREDRHAQLLRRAASSAAPPGSPPAWDDLLVVLDEELARLPDRYRAPLLACYLDGWTQDEAARQLGWSVSTLRRRLEAARTRLRVRLTARGATLGGGLVAGVVVPATAAVPGSLARAAVESAAGGAAPARVLALAGGGSALVKWASSTAVVLVVAGLAIGFGAGQDDRRPEPPPSATRPPVAATDLPAEPLPPGAVARMGSLRFRHPGWAPRLEFALGGKVLVSFGGTGAASIWNARTGELVRTLGSRHDDEKAEMVVNGVGLAADGRMLTVNASRVIGKGQFTNRGFTWDLERDVEVRAFPVGLAPARQTSFTGPRLFAPDGSRMAEIDSLDGTIWLWDMNGKPAGRLERAVVGGLSGLNSQLAAFAPDGKTLYSTLSDHTIQVWDTATGKRTRSFGTGKEQPVALAVSANGKYLATFADRVPRPGAEGHLLPGAVRVWDPVRGDRIAEIPWEEKTDPKGPAGSHRSFVGFFPDGSLWAVVASDTGITFRQWDRETGRQTREWVSPVLGRERVGVALSPDGSRLAIGSSCGLIELLDAETGKNLTPGGGHRGEISGLRFTPDGKRLLTVSDDRTARTWDVSTGKELRVLSGLGLYALPSADAGMVFTARARPTGDGRYTQDLVAKDTQTGRELWTCPGEAEFVQPGADPKEVWVSLKDPKSIAQLNPTSGKVVRSLPITTSPVLFVDGGRLAVAFDGKEFSGWDTTTGRKRFTWNPRTAGLFRNGTFKVGDQDREYVDHQEAVALSPDGRFLAVVVRRNLWITDDAASLYLCEAATGKVVWQAKSDAHFGRSVAFGPNGKSVAVAGPKARLFDVASGKELGAFDGHRGYIVVVAFSPDGKRLATGGADGTAVVWDLPRK